MWRGVLQRGCRRTAESTGAASNWLEIFLQHLQPAVGRVIAVEHNSGVRRMVEALMKALEVAIGEVGDGLWVAARIHAIGIVGIKRLLAELAEHRGGRGIGALHLVEHHALVAERHLPRRRPRSASPPGGTCPRKSAGRTPHRDRRRRGCRNPGGSGWPPDRRSCPGKVMALRNVFIELFSSSTKGFFTGYLRLPQSTECSRICATPVESSGGVLKVTPNTLFSSSLTQAQHFRAGLACADRAGPRRQFRGSSRRERGRRRGARTSGSLSS